MRTTAIQNLLLAFVLATVGCEPDLTPQTEVVRPRIMAVRIEAQDEPARATPRFGETAVARFQMGYPDRPPADPDGDDPPPRVGYRTSLCVTLQLPDGSRGCLWEAASIASPDGLADEGPDGFAVTFEVPTRAELFEAAGLSEEQALGEGSEFDAIQDLLEGGAFPELVLFGALCDRGRVRRDDEVELSTSTLPDAFSCRRSDELRETEGLTPEPLTFTRTLSVQDIDGPNLRPTIGCEGTCVGIERENEPNPPGDIVLVRPLPGDAEEDAVPSAGVWQPPPEDINQRDLAGCQGDGLPQVRIGEDAYRIRVRFDPEDRQRLPDDVEVPEGGRPIEELFAYIALTEDGGDLDGYARLLDADTPRDELEVEWEYTPPPNQKDLERRVTEKGRIVRFYFAARDSRFAFDFTHRALCLLPEK